MKTLTIHIWNIWQSKCWQIFYHEFYYRYRSKYIYCFRILSTTI